MARVRIGDDSVVVKLLTGADPFHAGLFHNEIRVYAALTSQPATVPVPVPLLAVPACLVLQDIPNRVLDPGRYPTHQLPETQVRAVLDALRRFAAWCPASLPANTEAAELLHAKAITMLDTVEAEVFHTVRGRCRQWQLAHGDAIPSNLLTDTDDGACTLIDFENTGWHLPGWDYAVLRSVLAAQPTTITTMIDQFAVRHVGQDAYTINLVAAAAREMRLHQFFPPDPTGVRERVVNLAWAQARSLLRRHLAAQPQSGVHADV